MALQRSRSSAPPTRVPNAVVPLTPCWKLNPSITVPSVPGPRTVTMDALSPVPERIVEEAPLMDTSVMAFASITIGPV